MSFRIALSGIGAANSALNTTANNIANVDTPGFKRSRAEFGDLFANSGYGLSRNTIGSGVRVTGLAQQFAQGTINFTNNALDLAISGNGFFTLSRDGGFVYSRAGNFGVDSDGYVVNPVGDRLQAFTPVVDGTGMVTGFNTGQLADLRLTNSESAPAASTTVEVGTNLPAAIKGNILLGISGQNGGTEINRQVYNNKLSATLSFDRWIKGLSLSGFAAIDILNQNRQVYSSESEMRKPNQP